MKKINYKTLIITNIVCLLPILLGVFFYQCLPDQIAGHFNINNQPDQYFSKNFVVFGLPILMVLLQTFCCIIGDLSMKDNQKTPKLAKVVKWIIPTLSIVMYTITIFYALGNQIDIRKVICLVLGIMIFLMGNYMPKMSIHDVKNIHPRSLANNEMLWKKINRITGYSFVLLGLLFIISILLPPIVAVVMIMITIILILLLGIYTYYLAGKESK